MARVELNIVALGDFKSVNTQIAALKAQIESLNKNLAGVGLNNGLVKDLNAAQAAFKATMLSTGQFTAQTIKLKSETDKFGEALVGGKLKLNEYFNIIRNRSSQASAQMRALAVEQTKLQNSIVMADPTKQGIFSVFTPTRINEVANATKIATNMQNIYNIAVEKGTQSLINWGKNTQWAGRQLTVGLTVPMAIFGSTAMKTFQEVNDQIVRLQKVYGSGITQPTAAALAEIKSQTLGLAKELASSMGIAAKETTAMAADLAATGLQGQDLIAGTREAMRLAKLGELDTQQAMQATVSLQNVYKLSTQELSGAVNFLNAVENQTSTSLQDLVENFGILFETQFQLSATDEDGDYQLATISDDGSILEFYNQETKAWQRLVDNSGMHAAKMSCALKTLKLTKAGKPVPIRILYYQGPKYQIALDLVARKVNTNCAQNPQAKECADFYCGKIGENNFYLEKEGVLFKNDFAKHWKALRSANFSKSVN